MSSFLFSLAKFAAGAVLTDLFLGKGMGIACLSGKGVFSSGIRLGGSLAQSLLGGASPVPCPDEALTDAVMSAIKAQARQILSKPLPRSEKQPFPAGSHAASTKNQGGNHSPDADILKKYTASSIPGRVRVRHEALRQAGGLEALKARIEAQGAQVAFNHATGSALVTFDCAKVERASALAPLAEYLAARSRVRQRRP